LYPTATSFAKGASAVLIQTLVYRFNLPRLPMLPQQQIVVNKPLTLRIERFGLARKRAGRCGMYEMYTITSLSRLTTQCAHFPRNRSLFAESNAHISVLRPFFRPNPTSTRFYPIRDVSRDPFGGYILLHDNSIASANLTSSVYDMNASRPPTRFLHRSATCLLCEKHAQQRLKTWPQEVC